MEFQYIGKIGAEKEIEAEFGKLYSDDIIITDERITHIKDHHIEDYSLFEKNAKEAVVNPDAVTKDGKNTNTVLWLNVFRIQI